MPSLRPAARKAAAPVRAARLSCAAQKQEAPLASTAAAMALAAGLALSAAPAQADVAGLTPCSESKAYKKVQKKELKGLEKRLKLVRLVICIHAMLVHWIPMLVKRVT